MAPSSVTFRQIIDLARGAPPLVTVASVITTGRSPCSVSIAFFNFMIHSRMADLSLTIRLVSSAPKYLEPYLTASARFGGGFGSLLWATPNSQAARFDAICRLQNLDGRSVLDAGCGRADLLEHCTSRGMRIADYIGIEAVPALASAAMQQSHPNMRIITADFIEQPASLFVGADVVVISGALNTLDSERFYTTIRRAFDAAAEALVMNFLDSPMLAAADFLSWYHRQDVIDFAHTMTPDVRILHDYLDGDSTIALRKEHSS